MRKSALRGRSPTEARLRRVMLVCGAFLCTGATLPAQRSHASVPVLPAPTGAYAVGTTLSFLVDSARRDPIGHNRFGGRPIPVQLWYPASVRRNALRAPYIWSPALLARIVRDDYYGIDPALLASWSRIVTHSYSDAPVSAGKHPLVTLSAGLGVATANYTAIAEDLASHGYIVAGVDHPYEGFAVLPGDVTETADDDSANASDDASVQRSQISAWSRDISFVLDRLQRDRTNSVTGTVARTIDWNRVGAFGHSSGGLIAVEACGHDPRLRACVNLDGGPTDPHGDPIAPFVSQGFKRPILFLLEKPVYSDADLAKRHMTRAQFESRGGDFNLLIDSLKSRARAPFYLARIAGTGHFSFTDAPFVMPTTITRFGGKIIDRRRGLRIITTTLRTFFDHNFNSSASTVTSLSSRFNELVFQIPGATH